MLSPWHIDEVPLAVVLPDLQPDLEHDVFLLVLRLRGPAGPVTLAAGLLERLREADEDLVDGLGHVAAEHVALDHVAPALAAARVAHRAREGETRLFVGLSLAAGEKYYSVNPELRHTRPKRYSISMCYVIQIIFLFVVQLYLVLVSLRTTLSLQLLGTETVTESGDTLDWFMTVMCSWCRHVGEV